MVRYMCVCVYNDIMLNVSLSQPKRTIVLHYYQSVGETFLLIFYSALYTFGAHAQWYIWPNGRNAMSILYIAY